MKRNLIVFLLAGLCYGQTPTFNSAVVKVTEGKLTGRLWQDGKGATFSWSAVC